MENTDIKFSELPKKFRWYIESRLDASMQREMNYCGLWWEQDLEDNISIESNLKEILEKNGIDVEDGYPYVEFKIIEG
jgi:hypothetical protein